ncbi:MAG: AsmA family protein, partial [Pseudomonadota bacterium]
MKKALYAIGIVLVAFVGAVLVVPGLIDWNDYKTEIAARVRAATGREATLKGDIRLSLLPAPALSVADVSLASLPGAQDPQTVRLKRLDVRIALAPLLSGQIKVETIRLVDPVLVLETLADGRRTWDFAPVPGAGDFAPVPGAGGPKPGGAATPGPSRASGLAVNLDNIFIENGTVVVRDARANVVRDARANVVRDARARAAERFEAVYARVTAGSLDGPFAAVGSLKARGVAIQYIAALGRLADDRAVPLNVNLSVPGAKLQSSGTLSGLGQAPRYRGKVKIEGESLSALLAATGADGLAVPPLARPFAVEGNVVATQALTEVKDIDLRLGEVRGAGALAVRTQGGLGVALQLAVNRLDLDAWLADAAPAPSAAKSGAPKSGAGTPVPTPAPPKEAKPFSIPKDMTASLAFSADAITLRGGLVGQARLKAELAEGEITLSQFSAQLPGSADVALFGFVTAAGDQPKFDGQTDVSVGDLRALMKWLGVADPDVPADRLRALKLTGKLAVTPKEFRASGIDASLDGSRLTGTASMTLGARPLAKADLTLDRLNVDSYFPFPAPAPAPKAIPVKPVERSPADAAATPPAPAKPAPGGMSKGMTAVADVSALRELPEFEADVKFAVKAATWRGLAVRDASVDAGFRDWALDVRRIAVADMAGASFGISGRVDGLSDLPWARNVRFEARAADIARTARAFGIEPAKEWRGLGAVSAEGKLEGNFLTPQIDAKIGAGGATATFAGKVALIPVLALDGKVSLAHGDLGRLAAALGSAYRPAAASGPLNVSGTLKAGATAVEVTDLKASAGTSSLAGTAKADFGGARPRVSADLTAGDLVLDSFLPAKKSASLAPDPASPPRRDAQLRPGVVLAQAGQRPTVRPVAPPSSSSSSGARGRWSTEPLDLAALKGFDAEVKLKAHALVYERYRLEEADLAARLNAGALKTERAVGKLFGGDFQGSLAVDANPSAPRVDASFALKNGDVGRAVVALTGQQTASGKIALEAKLATAGNSVAAMIGALGGSGSLALHQIDAKGRSEGSALAGALGLVRGLGEIGGLLSGRPGGAATADVTATFTVDRGVARTND